MYPTLVACWIFLSGYDIFDVVKFVLYWCCSWFRYVKINSENITHFSMSFSFLIRLRWTCFELEVCCCFFVCVWHIDFLVVTFDLNLYTLLLVWYNVNSCLLPMVCVSSHDITFIMIQFVAFDLIAMVALHANILLFYLCWHATFRFHYIWIIFKLAAFCIFIFVLH